MTYHQLYLAALKTVREMGPDLKNVSWFKRNWTDANASEEAKKAA